MKDLSKCDAYIGGDMNSPIARVDHTTKQPYVWSNLRGAIQRGDWLDTYRMRHPSSRPDLDFTHVTQDRGARLDLILCTPTAWHLQRVEHVWHEWAPTDQERTKNMSDHAAVRLSFAKRHARPTSFLTRPNIRHWGKLEHKTLLGRASVKAKANDLTAEEILQWLSQYVKSHQQKSWERKPSGDEARIAVLQRARLVRCLSPQ